MFVWFGGWGWLPGQQEWNNQRHKETNTKTSHCRNANRREATEESGLLGAENVALLSGIVPCDSKALTELLLNKTFGFVNQLFGVVAK